MTRTAPDPEIASHADAWRSAIERAAAGDDTTARSLVLPTIGPGIHPRAWSMRILAGAAAIAIGTVAEHDAPNADERWTIRTVGFRPLEPYEDASIRVVEALLNSDPIAAEATADAYIRWDESGVRARLVALLHYLLAWHIAALTGRDTAASPERGAGR